MLRHFTVLMFVTVTLAGCAADESAVVHNACTDHPMYGTGNPHVTIHTNLGNMTAEIFVDKVPVTGMNFVKLAEDGSFDGAPFHRIIENFMMQGGDYTDGNGRGGRAHGDCANAQGDIPDEFDVTLRHQGPGILSMANAGAGTGSSQFFITFVSTAYLDAYDGQDNLKNCAHPQVSCHPVFGKIVDGLDTLQRVQDEAAAPNPGTPRIPVTFESATVTWP